MPTETEISPFSRRAFGALEKRTADAERRAAAAELRTKEAEARAKAAEARSPDAEVLLHITERLDTMADRLDAIEKAGRKRARAEASATGDAADILHRYDEIGAFLRIGAKQAEHRARAGEIPTFKLGRIVCARRSTLLAWMAEQEKKTAKAKRSR